LTASAIRPTHSLLATGMHERRLGATTSLFSLSIFVLAMIYPTRIKFPGRIGHIVLRNALLSDDLDDVSINK
jgi:hypothetical protein